MTPEFLAAKVNAVNSVNAFAHELHEKLCKTLTPWIGKKVLCKDGSLVKTLASQLPDFPLTVRANFFMYRPVSVSGSQMLTICVETRFALNPSGRYSHILNLGYVENYKLASVSTLDTSKISERTDWTMQEVLNRLATAAKYKKLMEDSELLCGPFA